MKSFLYILFNEVKRFFSIREYRILLMLALKYGTSKRYEKKEIAFDGHVFVVADFKSFFWQYKQIYVDKCYQFKTEEKNPVILDCGANVGLSALFFSRSYPSAKIVAYEADANIYNCLLNNIQKNKVRNVEALQKAVWTSNAGITFLSEGADGGAVCAEGTAVESVALKDEIENYQKISLLKMDIEGAEVEVIRSVKDVLHKCENVFIEYHSFAGKEQHLHELLTILSSNGFRYYLKEEVVLSQPFVTKGNPGPMDMQINIFAYK
ncbi:MAG: FkbM family methyltransferase [Bacteroidetes bacterium]|nr:FkbM family methyltransferase [Bacteroidota bacterium]